MENPDFEALADLSEDVLAGIRDLGWKEPMPVQHQVIPLMRTGRDLIVQARTGSGKTGAFGIPIVSDVECERREVQALVLTPTRELAQQVCTEIIAMGKHRGVRTLPVYGGTGYQEQLDALREGVHVVVGTPGRILDHLGSGRMDFSKVRTVVFDEADEMLSLGFWPDMKEIRSYLPERRQSCLFSATIPAKVLALSRAFLHDPEFVSLVEGHASPTEIEHFFCLVSANEKEECLRRVLEHEDPDSAIIFCNTKDDVRYVTAYLQRRGFDADQISGDLTQVAREKAMKRIKAGELRILVATDVAARGIDISDLSHVISWAAPVSAEVYVHRTGRTGRAGRTGTAISLVSGLDIGNFRNLQKVNKITVAERPVPSEADILARLRDRLAVKVEQEIRHLTPQERQVQVDRFLPIVDQMAKTDEGRRELAAICGRHLIEHRPQTSVPDPAIETEAAPPGGGGGPSPDRPPEGRPPRRRRRSGGGGGGGGRGRR